MNTEIHWGRVLVMLIVVAGIAWLFFLVGKKSSENIANQSIVTPSSQKTVEKNKVQVKPVANTAVYRDTKYGFSFELPKSFFQQKTIDGMTAYNLYFTNKEISNDYTTLTGDDVQLQISVAKDKTKWDVATETTGLKSAGFTVSEPTQVMIAGITGTTIDGNKAGGACFKRTFFKKNGISYEVSFSNDIGCTGISTFINVYSKVLSSFQFE